MASSESAQQPLVSVFKFDTVRIFETLQSNQRSSIPPAKKSTLLPVSVWI